MAKLSKNKVPTVIINKSLNKYDNVVLFPEKLAKANQILRTVGLPKEIMGAIVKVLVFNKEGEQWFIDLPEYPGNKLDLLMVAGADRLLDKLSCGKSTVTLLVSEEQPTEPGFEKLKKLMNTPLIGGATYTGNFFLPIWLCDVTRFIYDGRLPDTLYYKVAN